MCFAPHQRVLFATPPFPKVLRTRQFLTLLTFDFQACFAPQPRAFVQHFNWQSSSGREVQNLLGATTACNCSSFISPDGSAPATLASLLFDPPGPRNIGKTQCLRLFYFVAHLNLLSSAFCSLIFSLLPFSSRTALPAVAASVHIVGGFTSKPPWI